ncbi:cholinesterase 1-like [Branchiostoma floridae]|uniref:Carboxylic ester hydrolase n=1 Tax=Branchiostoma floridae TaxID=7739 RepID=A0A9J7N9G6_BRAFL|nr:cholinesterase 1-like [Branchiostoma floridae]XP_035694715.1 cholinesterase 1-like [Branchiostoma floridae]XP_035694716.1 cholinesterase 1-like [Branchiostoma floridae]
MPLGMAVYILAALCAAMLSPAPVQAAAEVTAPAGRLVGLEQDVFGTTVHAFLGIPFAHPPVGNRRFRRAEHLPPWDGVYNATTNPNACIQATDDPVGPPPNNPTSEDCLYLNIYRPTAVSTGAAVMVWIHGGAFISGAGAIYYGGILAATEGVIVVTVNYRLNVLGFLCTGTDDAPGNMGLTDQLLALQWVQDNIPSFGGDSSKVTIFGESAGAVSVGHHLLSPESRNVFSRAILESGTALLPGTLDTMSGANDKAMAFSESLGCPTDQGTAALLTCLRSKDAQQFATSATELYPVADDVFIPANPAKALEDGMFKRADILIGANTNEGVFLLGLFGYSAETLGSIDGEQFMQALNSAIPAEVNELAVEAIVFQYTNWLHPDADTRYRDILDAASGDYSFVCPAVTTALAHARYGTNVYMYEFGYRPSTSTFPDWVVASHGEEIQFWLGLPVVPAYGYSTEDAEVSRRMMRHWGNFAKTGDPNDNNNEPAWNPFTETDRAYLLLDGRDPKMMNGWKTTECAMWDVYIPSLVNKTGSQGPMTSEPVQCQTTTEVVAPAVWGQSLTLALLFNLIKDVISFVTTIFVL